MVVVAEQDEQPSSGRFDGGSAMLGGCALGAKSGTPTGPAVQRGFGEETVG